MPTDPAVTARGPLTLTDLLRVAEDLALQEGKKWAASQLRWVRQCIEYPGEPSFHDLR